MTNIRAFSFVSAFVLLTGAAPAKTEDIVILGTSDLHGRLAQLPILGGYFEVIRAAHPNRVITLDAGDVFQGTLESDMNEGEVATAAYEQLGYDAIAIGNHDFDFGPAGAHATPQGDEDPRGALKARALQSNKHFPFLDGNLLEKGAVPTWPNVRPSIIVALKNGPKVGIIGASTIDTPTTTIAANFVDMKMIPLLEAVGNEAKKLRAQGADIVVLVAHAGGRCTKFEDAKDLATCDAKAEIFKLVQALPAGTLDAVVAGHTHSGVAQEVNGVPIIESFAQGQAFGRIDLQWDGKHVTGHTLHAPTHIAADGHYEDKAIVPSKAIAATIAPALATAEVARKAPLGVNVEGAFERSYGAESAMGNLVVSVMLHADPRAQIALTNGGGLRADFAAGPLHFGDLYTVLPFENRLATVSMSGADLRSLLAHNLQSSSGILSLAGATLEAHCVDKTLVVELTKDAGGVIKDSDEVNIVTNDFLATGGDGFKGGKTLSPPAGAPTIRDSVIDWFKAHPQPLRAADWYKKDAPRLRLPKARPVICGDAPPTGK